MSGRFTPGTCRPDQRVATFFRAESPTLVLGSSQRDDSVDGDAAARQGIDDRSTTLGWWRCPAVARTSSSGSISRSLTGDDAVERRRRALDVVGGGDVARGARRVRAICRRAPGRLIRTRWSSDVCFAGTGPGEVLVGDAKLVGISQRRTRRAARFQTMVHLRWRPDVVASLVAEADGGGADAAREDAVPRPPPTSPPTSAAVLLRGSDRYSERDEQPFGRSRR